MIRQQQKLKVKKLEITTFIKFVCFNFVLILVNCEFFEVKSLSSIDKKIFD